jgi:hypothetical protein
LKNIINDPEKRKKLVVYINPPYAEATSAKTVTGTGENKAKTSTDNKTYLKYKSKIGKASNELFAQFLIRIYCEIPTCKIANFSKLKSLQSTNFQNFRKIFRAKLEKIFLVPANTFDNVQGEFPIGFFIWNAEAIERFEQTTADVYNFKGDFIGEKKLYGNLSESINKWIKIFDNKNIKGVGYMENPAPDFQNNKFLCITNYSGTRHVNYYCFNEKSLISGAIYFSVRLAIEPTWLNDRDQFLYPNDGWETDTEFQNDCLAFALFHSQNRITSGEGINHWIPFTEQEVNAGEKFESHFMTDFIKGKPKPPHKSHYTLSILFEPEVSYNRAPLKFSEEATAVFDAGRELWKYYHRQSNCNVNASLYDIKEHFQGRNEAGKMNNKSTDKTYMNLIGHLRDALKQLAEKIEPKVYEYEFLKK